MSKPKIIIGAPDGSKIWINVGQMVKMCKTPDGRYFLYMITGEVFEVDRRTASAVEACLEND